MVLCFRELDNASVNPTYCPLGFATYMAGIDGPPEVLGLREGADSLDPAYPGALGMMVTIAAIGEDEQVITISQATVPRVSGVSGTLLTHGPAETSRNPLYIVTLGVNCTTPAITGLDCTIPATSEPPTTGMLATTSLTTEIPTTDEELMITNSSVEAFTINVPSLGIHHHTILRSSLHHHLNKGSTK